MPIFEEVYEQAKKENPDLPYIELGYIDSMNIDAFAIGRHTIAVSQGAIEGFSEEELQGVLAHEIGHIRHGHTKALLLNVIGNGVFTILILLMKGILLLMELMGNITGGFGGVFSIFRHIFEIIIMLFTLIGYLILAINSRQNEYQADNFALQSGFGDELIKALYLLQKFSLGENMGLMERLKSSHPHINKRIERLENLATA